MLRQRDGRAHRRRAALAGGSGADRRSDRDQARGGRRGARGRPGLGRASGSRWSRSTRSTRYAYKPPFPLTVIVNPMIEPLSDEQLADQRGLPLGARPAGRRAAFLDIRRPVSRSNRRAERDRGRGPDRRHVPARGRPPRRRAVPRPRHRTRRRSRPGSSSSATTADDFLRRIGAVHARRQARRHPPGGLGALPLVRARVGRRRPAPQPASCWRSRGGDRPRDRRGQGPPDGSERLRRPRPPGSRQRPFARIPAGAAWTYAGQRGSFWTWRKQMYALAGATRPGHDVRAHARDVRRDGAGGDDARGRVPLPAPRRRRHSVRRPERDGQRGDARGAARPACG